MSVPKVLTQPVTVWQVPLWVLGVCYIGSRTGLW